VVVASLLFRTAESSFPCCRSQPNQVSFEIALRSRSFNAAMERGDMKNERLDVRNWLCVDGPATTSPGDRVTALRQGLGICFGPICVIAERWASNPA
jgi:hypothetical protein